MKTISIEHYLFVAAALFSIGLAIAITKRHFIGILLGIELMLNAVNLNLIAFSRYDPEKIKRTTVCSFCNRGCSCRSNGGTGNYFKGLRTF